MAVTPIGTTTVTAISRRLILPRITDNIYGSNPLFFRWNRMNKIVEKGGTQIEIPVMYSKMAGSQWYSGYQVLNITPTDSIQNGALPWAQLEVAVTVDGLTLLRASSNEAIVDYIATQFKQAEMDIADQLGNGLFSDGVTNTSMTVGLYAAVDNGSVATSYEGIAHSGNTWWNCQIDSTTTTMGTAALQALFGSCTSGGRGPTIIISSQSNYNRYWALNLASQQFPVQPGGRDQQMAQAGFENLLFNGVPWMVDSHCGTGVGNSLTTAQTSGPLFLNESYFEYVVSERANCTMRDFQSPVNQDAMTALLLWAGQLTCSNISRQGIMTALTG
jgi:hypothetical protein